MAKLSNITAGIAVVKEKIKATDVVRVYINAMGLTCNDIEDERLKSDIINALEPAKGIFLQNPRAVCEISVIDPSFSSIYRIEKKFCITDALYVDPQQIAATCGLPFTPAQRLLLTPKMVLDIQAIMSGQSNTNICEYLKFNANALSSAGTPVYGLTINKVFVKDRRAVVMTRVPDDQWSMSDTYKDIIWKSLVNIAYGYLQKNSDATIDDVCKLFIKTYGSKWIPKLVAFGGKSHTDVSLPSYMTALASSEITSEQLVNAYQLMRAILKGKFTGVNKMDRDDTVEYIKNMQSDVKDKLEGTEDPFDSEKHVKGEGEKKLDSIEKKLDDIADKVNNAETSAKKAADTAEDAEKAAEEAESASESNNDSDNSEEEEKDEKEEKEDKDKKEGEEKEEGEEGEEGGEDNDESSEDEEEEEGEDEENKDDEGGGDELLKL